MNENWKKIKLEYINSRGDITLKQLAETHGVKIGTLRSRKSREDWDSEINSVATCNATQRKSVATGKEMSWLKIEKEYVSDVSRKPCTLKDLSEKYDIPFKTVEDYSYKNKWSALRKKYKRSVREETLRKTSDKISDEFSTINASLIATLTMAATKSQKVIQEELTLGAIADLNGNPQVLDFKVINSKKMKEVMDSIRIIQDGIFKGFGKDKEIELEKLKIAQDKLALEKAKVSGDDEDTEDDGFIDALEGKVEDIWDDVDEDEE